MDFTCETVHDSTRLDENNKYGLKVGQRVHNVVYYGDFPDSPKDRGTITHINMAGEVFFDYRVYTDDGIAVPAWSYDYEIAQAVDRGHIQILDESDNIFTLL